MILSVLMVFLRIFVCSEDKVEMMILVGEQQGTGPEVSLYSSHFLTQFGDKAASAADMESSVHRCV